MKFFSKVKKEFLEKFNSCLFSACFGAIITVLLFFFTAHPTDSVHIKDKLEEAVENRIIEDYSLKAIILESSKLRTEQLVVNSEDFMVLIGSFKSEPSLEDNEFIAIFNRRPINFLDKLIGRDGFYSLAALTIIPFQSLDDIQTPLIETLDLDADGFNELHVQLKSVWGDAISVAPLIYKRIQNGEWALILLPSTAQIIKDFLVYGPKVWGSSHKPFFIFARDPKKKQKFDLSYLDNPELWEDEFVLKYNNKDVKFYSLSNGGKYFFTQHPVKGYFQVGVMAFFNDQFAVQDDHFVSVHFLKLNGYELSTDILWNWGCPMFSGTPYKVQDIAIADFVEAGIEAHIINNTYYGYTEFERYK